MDAKKRMPTNRCQHLDANKWMPTDRCQQMDATLIKANGSYLQNVLTKKNMESHET